MHKNDLILDLIAAMERARSSGITDSQENDKQLLTKFGHEIIDLIIKPEYKNLKAIYILKTIGAVLGLTIRKSTPSDSSAFITAVEICNEIISTTLKK